MDLGKLSDLTQRRECKVCGAAFEVTEKQTTLEQFSDHSTIHNPSPAQWAKAHEIIQVDREKAKGRKSAEE